MSLMALTETKLEELITDEVMRTKFKDLVRCMPKNGVRGTGLG
jgi:hypothetical protein